MKQITYGLKARTPPQWKILDARLEIASYLWSVWDSKQIRLPRTGICRKAATWRSCVRWGHGPDMTAQLWHSSGQIASTWSGCECGRTDSSLGPVARRSGTDPLKQYQKRKLMYNIKFTIMKTGIVLWITRCNPVVAVDSQQHSATILYPEGGNSTFLRHAVTDLPNYTKSLSRGDLWKIAQFMTKTYRDLVGLYITTF